MDRVTVNRGVQPKFFDKVRVNGSMKNCKIVRPTMPDDGLVKTKFIRSYPGKIGTKFANNLTEFLKITKGF